MMLTFATGAFSVQRYVTEEKARLEGCASAILFATRSVAISARTW